jgi:hypothetical protein
MQPAKWNAVHDGHLIHVTTTNSGGAKRFIDDECADTTNDLYASAGEPTLVGVFGENDEFLVEAFVTEHTEAEIRVNGEWIAGDKIYAVASD